MSRLGENAYVANCEPCGKRTFASRGAARKTAKQIPGRRMNAYPCPHAPGWHLGHLPTAVVRGSMPKGAYLATVARRRSATS